MSLKEIKSHHQNDNNTCGLMNREMFQIHRDRAELLELLAECKQTFILLSSAYDETIIKKILTKLD